MRHFALASMLMMAACGGGSNPADDTGDDVPPADAPPGTPDADNSGWTTLISRSWSVPAGVNDVYRCVRIQVDHDIYISGFRSDAPQGSHHAVLTFHHDPANPSPPGPLGEYNCSVNTLDMAHMLYASGVGTDDFVFPAGVGVLIPAGAYVNLNLHLFNAGENQISGTSGVLVQELSSAPAELADMTFAGDISLNIPPTGAPHDEQGGCTLNRDYHLVALWPHMHQLATHQKVELIRNSTTTVLLDTPFSFSDQRNWPQNPVLDLLQGDRIRVTCTYVNTTGSTVNFGDSSTAEMCFNGLYVYPAANQLFGCVF